MYIICVYTDFPPPFIPSVPPSLPLPFPETPTLPCENERCRRLFHPLCLRQWLQTLPDTKVLGKEGMGNEEGGREEGREGGKEGGVVIRAPRQGECL